MRKNKIYTALPALAALLVAGCSTVDTTTVPMVDRSSYDKDTAAPILSSTVDGTGAMTLLTPGSVKDSGRVHTVAPGDTLYNISLRYGFEPQALATLNAVSDPTALRIGQTLRLPVSTKAPVTTANPTVRVSRITDLSTNTPEPTSIEPAEETAAAAPVSGKTASETKPAAKEEPAPQPPKTVPGTRMIWPANGKILSDFSANGKGLDIGGVEGDLVVAAGAGTVLFVGENVKGYGNLVIIKHSDSIVTAYGHNRKIVVKTNDRVKAGQKIAEMGSNNGVPQVRFEVRLRGKAVNPSEYLPARR